MGTYCHAKHVEGLRFPPGFGETSLEGSAYLIPSRRSLGRGYSIVKIGWPDVLVTDAAVPSSAM